MIRTPEFKVLVYFSGKALSALVSLAIIPLFIKWFGNENYGKYIIIYVTFLIFISGAIGWINQSIIKYHGDHEDSSAFYASAHNINFKVALFATVPLLFTIYFSGVANSLLLFTTVGFSFILACRYTSKLIEKQAEMESLVYSTSEILRLLVFLGFTFVFKKVEALSSLEIIFIGLFFSYLFPLFFLDRKFNFKDFRLDKKIDFSLAKKFLHYGLPLSLWMVFSPSANGIDKYILNHYVGASVLAQYAAVYDVVFKVFTQLVNPINSVYQPLLMKINSTGDKSLFNKTLKKALFYLVLICVPVLLLFYFFRDFILINYLGFKDVEDIFLLKSIILPLALSAIIWQISIILQKNLEAQEKTKVLTFYIIVIVLISSLFSIWLLPIYDFTILAYINLIASVLYFIIIYFTSKYDKN